MPVELFERIVQPLFAWSNAKSPELNADRAEPLVVAGAASDVIVDGFASVNENDSVDERA